MELVYFGDEFFGLLNVQPYGVEVLICELDNFGLGSVYAQLELVGCFSPKSWPLGVDS